MKKLLILLIYTITFIPHLFGMELTPLKPKCHTHDALKFALIDHLSHNVHKYINRSYDSSTEASKIIVKVSRINIDLYNTLNNDPTIARDVITNVRQHCYNYNRNFMNEFRFPGVSKCRELSEQLYDDNLTEDKLEDLFNKGAVISFNPTPIELEHDEYYPIKYWCCPFTKVDQRGIKRTKDQSKKIIKKLLDLGANFIGDATEVLGSIIYNDNIDIVTMILPYKPKITSDAWFNAIERNSEGDQKYIDLLISHATPDELNAGLVNSLKKSNFKLMQKFIDHEANSNTIFGSLMKQLQNQQNIFLNEQFVQLFNFFCDNNAFDKDGLAFLRKMQESIGSLISKLEKNQPADISEIEKIEQ